MKEHGIDRLARWLARSDAGIQSPTPAGGAGSALDVIARAAAGPVTRRRALLATGGAVMATSLLRPGSARADCFPGGPQVCSNSKGMKVCVPNNLACCSNDNCAIACPYPWRTCEQPGNCADTAKMCSDPTAPGYLKGNTKFCSQRVAVTNGCVPGGLSSSVRGWCCAPHQTCSKTFGECECATQCGEDCCASNEDCVSLGLLQGSKCMQKCKPGWHHDGVNCVCDSGQTCGVNCCPAGSVCVGSTCSKPKTPSNTFFNPFDGFLGFGDAVNQTAASRSGSGHIAHLARISAGTTPVNGALLALGAVSAQGAAAATAFTDQHADGAYRHRVTPARPTPPPITAGPGLDPGSAAALRKLVAAEAKAFALVLASATAIARARGAADHKNLTAARQQVMAAAGFAGQAAKALGPVPSLRAAAAAALHKGGVAEVTVTAADVSAFQSSVQATGVPSDLAVLLRRLGVQGADLGRVKASLLGSSTGGPVLIAPLDDPARTHTLRALAGELAKFSRDAGRQPITRERPAPRRYRSHAAA
jgi:hypothetical protein